MSQVPTTVPGCVRHPHTSPYRQRGAALVVTLLLLLVVTLLGLAAMRGTLLQERMAANAIARGFAFQVAEAVLREAEGFATSKPPAPTAGCTNGVCAAPKKAVPVWHAANFWESNSGWALAQAETDGIRPKYVIEPYGTGTSSCTQGIDMSAEECDGETTIYRITVLSRAPDGAEVMLQSLYEVP